FTEKGTLNLLRKRVSVVVQGQYLILKPICVYEQSILANPLYKGNTVLLPKSGTVDAYRRNRKAENEFHDLLNDLHSEFPGQKDVGYLSLPITQVVTGTWLAQTVKVLQDQGVEVLGLDDLQGFHFSPYPAECDVEINGDKDWFDVSMTVSFG